MGIGEQFLRLAKFFVFSILCLRNPRLYYRLKAFLIRNAVQFGFYEKVQIRMLKKLVQPGDTVVDIGANFGAYTAELLKLVGEHGQVLAFEPLPDVFTVLSENFCRERNLRIFNVALSDHESGHETIFVPRLTGGIPEPALASLSSKSDLSDKVFIEVKRLDNYSDIFTSLKFIKADIEGHELQFLSGGMAIIKRFRPAIQIEENNPQSNLHYYQEICAALDYKICTAGDDLQFIPLGDPRAPRTNNYYLLPSEVLANIGLL